MVIPTRPRPATREQPFVPDAELLALRAQRQQASAEYGRARAEAKRLADELAALERRDESTLEPEDLLTREGRARELRARLSEAHDRLVDLAGRAADPSRIAAEESQRAEQAKARELYEQAGQLARQINVLMSRSRAQMSPSQRDAHDERVSELRTEYESTLATARAATDRSMRAAETELDKAIKAEMGRARDHYHALYAERITPLLGLLAQVRDELGELGGLLVAARRTSEDLSGTPSDFGYQPPQPGFYFWLSGNEANPPPARAWIAKTRNAGIPIPEKAEEAFRL